MNVIGKINDEIIRAGHSWVFGLGSLGFGINLIFKPFTIQHSEEALHLIGMMMEHWALALLFIIFALIKLIGIQTGDRRCRLIGVVALTTLWTFIGFGFGIRVFQGSNNYGIIFTIIILMNAFCITTRGRFD